MSYCDFDPPEVYSERERRAAKLHRCVECRGPIKAGERYVYQSGIYDRRGFSYRTCAACHAWGQAFAEAARKANACDCWEFGTMWEAIGEFMR